MKSEASQDAPAVPSTGIGYFSTEVLAESLFEEIGLPTNSRFAIGYSGGCDSQALLHATSRLRFRYGIEVIALHFDHGLNECSDTWRTQCESWCGEFDVPFLYHRQPIRAEPGESLEAKSRQARYAWFEQITDKSQIILTAHHLDDQVETVMLNLFNGKGIDFLCGIKQSRPLSYGGRQLVVRPLLSVSRQALQRYNKEQKLSWINDPSNRDDRFDRNYLRNRVVPEILNRWPSASMGIHRSALKVLQVAQRDQRYLTSLYNDLRVPTVRGIFDLCDPLSLEKLSQLEKWDYVDLIRYWIHRAGKVSPSDRMLEESFRQIRANHEGAGGIQRSQYEVVGFSGCLHLIRRPNRESQLKRKCVYHFEEKRFQSLGIRLSSNAAAARGISKAKAIKGVVELGWREGGERITLPGRSFQHALKKVYQTLGIPPWEREWLPFILVDGEIAWVSGIGVVNGYQCEESEIGFCPEFDGLND